MAFDTDTVAVPGSYTQYKADTATFLAWLQRTALDCGYQYDDACGSRAPGDKLEPEIKVADVQLPVREILSQARIICSSTKAVSRLPKRICTLATRAISTRKAFTERWSGVVDQSPEDVARTASHEFFTGIMGEALGLLKEHSEQLPQAPFVPTAVLTPEDEVTHINNQFEHLDFEDCVEADWSLQIPVPNHEQQQNRAASQKRKEGEPLYPVDVHVDVEDTLMRIYCYFNDLHLIRTQVEALWKDYKEGVRELIPVAMASNAAVAIAEQMEHELLEELFPEGQLAVQDAPDYLGVKSSYAAILSVSMALSSGARRWQHLDPLIQSEPSSQLLFADLAIILHKLSGAFMVRKRDKKTMDDFVVLENAGKTNERFLTDFYPRVKTSEFVFMINSMHPALALASPSFERLKKLDDFLTPVLIDIILRKELGVSLEERQVGPVLCIDELTRALMQLESGKVGAAALLGCAIMKDTIDVLGPNTKEVLRKVHAYADECYRFVDESTFAMDKLELQNKLVWYPKDHSHNRNIVLSRVFLMDAGHSWQHFHSCFYAPQPHKSFNFNPSDDTRGWRALLERLPLAPAEHTARLKKLKKTYGRYFVPASMSPTMQMGANTLASGMFMFNFAIQKVEAGIALANTHIVLLNAAYLYVALQAQNMLKGQWRAMDQVIEMHISEMFFGGRPADPVKAQKLWELRTGMHPAKGKGEEKYRFASKGGHRTGKLGVKAAQASCLSTSDTTELFSNWLEGRESPIKTIHAAHQAMVAKDPDAKKKRTKPALDSLNFLHSFADFIATESQAWTFDYITFAHVCSDLLEAVHGKFFDGLRTKKDGTPASKLSRSIEDWKYGPELWGYDAMRTFIMVDSLLFQDKLWFENSGPVKAARKKGMAGAESPLVAVGRFVQVYMDKHRMLEAEGPNGVKGNLNSSSARKDAAESKKEFTDAGKKTVTVEEVVDEDF